jgi:glycerol-3-phosphate dehydrogenase subunit B
MIDLLVIGAGLSGLMAAHAAAKAGCTVKVIAKGLGTLHWSAGTIDLLGYGPGARADVIRRPLDVIDELGATVPGHPYALFGGDVIRTTLDEFRQLTEALGLPYGGAANQGENLLLPSPAGAARPTYLAPTAQLAGDLQRTEPMVIVGFEGLRDFYPALIAENLSKQGMNARAVMLPHDLLTVRTDANTIQLAHELDDGARAARLATALGSVAKSGERVGLPAILGLDNHAQTFATLQDTLNAPVFEIPTLPPSVPGVRLFKALRGKLEQMGVRVEAGMEVIAAEIAPRENGAAPAVRWVASETSARPLKHRAGHFVLATGGILGGGFNSDHTGHIWETVFDLPLTVPQARNQWFRPRFLDEAGHPVFHGGVAVNRSLQPVDEAGNRRYANLRITGGALAGYDPIVERSLEGVALVSGVAAGKALAPEESEMLRKIKD